jgi:NAD(P)-dependent dehydrogenase (short-subunit alcohol dehydrogenase family)
MMRLAGKIAVITGGGGGIGRATALRLAQEGASVAVLDINAKSAEASAQAVRDIGGVAEAYQLDISAEDSVAKAVDALVARFGAVHVLDNNATVAAHHHRVPDRAVTEMEVETWDETMAVNLRGTMLMCKYVIPVMIRSGGGSIINISSGAAISGDVRPMAYGVSKAGINAMTLYLASTYGVNGIRCNTVMPGPTATETFLELTPQARLDLYQSHMLVSRLGRPEDIANVVAFLASDDSAMVTGESIRVDGGIIGVHTPYMIQARDMPISDHQRGTTSE